MRVRTINLLVLAVVLTIGLALTGCSGESDLLKSVSGNWKGTQENEMVDIHLDSKDKSMTVNGKTYSVSVEKIEMVNYLVNLKVQNGSGQPESWSIQQLWDNNGDGYKLGFHHEGKKDILVQRGKS